MNRVIKFRVWDNCEEKMYYNVGLIENRILLEYEDIEPDYNSIESICYVDIDEINEKYFEVMQYTGLKDKNDKEIYEGDIVKYLDSYDSSNENGYDFEEYYNTGEVKYDEKIAAYEITNRNSVDMECIFDDIEVIGNIYENPELLKEV